MSRSIAVGLVHHPVLDRAGDVVTTAMTNLDLHDMSRSCRSYGVHRMFVVHPIDAQRRLAERIRTHWVEGSGRRRIPDRGVALEVVEVVEDLASVYGALAASRSDIEVWTTAAAARHGDTLSYPDARARLQSDEQKPVLLLFGTGWGLSGDVIRDADVRLAPIAGAAADAYNHLSVRAACAISLDRLLGER